MINPIIAISNHKGGPGKTTSTYWLARQFSAMGLYPLCIDLDSQGSLTRRMGGKIDHFNATGDVLAGRTKLLAAMQPFEADPNIGLIGTDIKINETATYIQGRSPNHNYLQRALREQRNEIHGPILIDCPPSADILVVNALVAADYLLIPVDPCEEAIEGMWRMVAMAHELTELLGQGPTVLGSIITKVNADTVDHRKYCDIIAGPGQPTVLGRTPLRQGVTAQRQIGAAYADIAHAIMDRIGG